MGTWKWLRGELNLAERLIASGEEKRALDRLRFLLEQYDPDDPVSALKRANIFHLMGKAKTSLEDKSGAEACYRHAVEEINGLQEEADSAQANLFMSISEHLSACSLYSEATHFAELALRCVMRDNAILARDDSAELLRRYACVAERSGAFSAAFLALSLGLLMVHEASGIESQIAEHFAALANRVCSVDSPKTIQVLGKCVVESMKRTASEPILQ